MKKTAYLIVISLLIFACESESTTTQTNVSLNFTHTWNGTPVTNSDFNTIKFTNKNGEQLSIERLRYLISDITFTSSNNENLELNAYNLIDVTNNQNLIFNPTGTIPSGTYNNVSFTFGFDNEDNYVDGGYPDLNSASFNVPGMLGGGYHYMQFDGKFINNLNEEQGFNYHAIRAVDNPGNPTFPKDTFFRVNLGPVIIGNETILHIEMNIAEWFKTPNTWDLNELNQMLMPNSAAQIMMFENGQDVFSLKSVN